MGSYKKLCKEEDNQDTFQSQNAQQCNSASCQSLVSWSHPQLDVLGLSQATATVSVTASATVLRQIEAAQRGHYPHARRRSTAAAHPNGRLSCKAEDASSSTTAPASTSLSTHALDFLRS